ncbi:MAG TPA: TonB-dependent receptor [Caulobacteraceae bacterium]|jgi:outer membrane receptor protein involved in Fe transport
MTSTDGKRKLLLATSALGLAAFAQMVLPQAAFAQNADNGNSKALEEVVVTATRQTSTVNKVALSVSAVTQKSLDQQGIRNVADLSTQVPGFTYRVTGGDSIPQLSLRGIGGNAIASTSGGAPTTGVYIDDIAMQKRNLNGATSGSGTPVPLLYDLDRIEVLRGPQGTLYGGSSEGGTIRFITPTPSLTTYSGSARLGVSTISGGGLGDEEGIALGGPIVPDKLGFRIAGFRQDRPGWINSYSEFDGHQFASGINKGNDYSLRGSLLWQVTPDFKVQVSVHNQFNYDQDSSSVRTSSPSINVPVRTLANTGLINGVAFSFPQTVFGGYTVPATSFLSNSARNGVVNGQYLTPTDVIYQPSPHRVMFTIPSVTLDYTWNDKLDFKSITADTMDRTSGYSFSGGNGERTSNLPYLTNQPCPSGPGLITPILNPPGTCTVSTPYLQFGATPAVAGQPSPNPTGAAGPANIASNYWYNNGRNQVTQEFRISTVDPSWKLQFVFGGFIEHELDTMTLCAPFGEAPFATLLRGANGESYYNGTLLTTLCQTPGAAVTDIASRTEEVSEDEQSIFGEANYQLTSKLKVTAGFRATNYTQNFWTRYGGPVGSAPAGWVGTADDNLTTTVAGKVYPLETNPNSTTPFANNYAACPVKPESVKTTAQAVGIAGAGCPYTYTVGTLHEKPVTPKVGVSYQLTQSDLLYATYSEGQRPGGINPPASPILCAPSFALLGITGSPPTYQHDYVKSTEVGGKFRLFDGQAQVNVAAFHIEWDNVQFVVQLPSCTGYSFVANAGQAASDGGELQFTGRAMGFTVNANVAYDDARFTQTVYGPHAAGTAPPASSLVANKGDNLGIPDWTANLGVQYDTRVMDFPAYGRIDYAYQGKYMRATSLGTASYTAAPYVTPNYINGNETHIMNARVGVYYKNLEIAGYVKNLFDSREWVNENQANGNYYYTGNTVQPRIIGMQMNYRF